MRAKISRILRTTNHKDIGVLYIVTSLFFGAAGFGFALLIRSHLALIELDSSLLSATRYNQVITMHGLVMILFFLSPLGFGLANYFVPIQIGAKDMAYPRLNALSYWLYLSGGLLAIASFRFPGGAPNTGWTLYAPLTSPEYTQGTGLNVALAGLLILTASVTVSTINFLATIFHMRAKGMTLLKMPLFTWSILYTSLMALYAFPSLGAALMQLLADRTMGTAYFAADGGGSILWGHLFWFFAHPEVYIVLLPSLGVVAEIIPTYTGRPLYGRNIIIASLGVATVMSYLVWAHHMFLTGISQTLVKLMTLTTELISIPFGVIVISFIASLYRGSIRFTTPFLFAIGSLVLFIIGGVTGVFQSSVALEYTFRGTYWVVGHFHYTMLGGGLVGLVAALYYWGPRITGRMYSERLGKLHFWLTFIGVNTTFFPYFFLSSMPRRLYTYPTDLVWGKIHLISTTGALIILIGQIFFIINLLGLRRGEKAEEAK